MKKTFKFLITLLLVAALIGSAVWYMFIYDRATVQDFLVGQARSCAQNGKFDTAAWFYNLSYKLSGEDQNVAIELADIYKSVGNYTKAEHTLTNAIADGGNAELYAALCRTYVEQDKLLDAVNMLDNISDPVIKAELDARRPAAPTADFDSGFYNQNIDLTFTHDTGTLYVTTNGEYPSTGDEAYSAPITLTTGETKIYALTVSEDGLVSPLSILSYTVGGVVEQVTLTDPAIDATVREQLSLSSNDPLMSDLLWSITHLTLPDTVKDLSDLPRFTGLQSLTIQNVSGLDFTVLNQLPTLQALDLSGCTISSNAMEAIGSLTELQALILNGCALTDISVFSKLTNLTNLRLSSNSLTEIGVVSLMSNLEMVDLSNNPISSIAALGTCNKLKYVDISGCAVNALGSLGNKTALETLFASSNQIKQIEDLATCKALSVLDITDNYVSDISILKQLPSLTRFDGDHNQITEIPVFDENNCILVYFSVDYNEIEDVSGLAGVDTLNYLNIDYNHVKDLLPLAENYNLVQVNAWDNAISEESVEALQEHSIILNYNPNYEDPDAEQEIEEN